MPQKKTVEMTKAEMDQAIKSTRPIDDELARVIFKDERAPELVQTILRTIPALKNVVVTKVNTQYDMPSLGFGKEYRLDIYATDSKGRSYDIELQRAKDGADPRRAFCQLAVLASEHVKKGQMPEVLPPTYVAFVTETDVMKKGKFLVCARMVDEDGDELAVDQYIAYMNAAYTDPEGKTTQCAAIAHDFLCSEPENMPVPVMRELTHKYKNTQDRVMELSAVIDEMVQSKMKAIKEEYRAEAISENNATHAVAMLKKGYGIDDIIDITGLFEADILRLAAENGLTVTP